MDSQHSFNDFVAFELAQRNATDDAAVESVRLADFDKFKEPYPATVTAYQLREDSIKWSLEHTTNSDPDDDKPGNMKIRVMALNHSPKGISPWLAIEEVPLWKSGKIPS